MNFTSSCSGLSSLDGTTKNGSDSLFQSVVVLGYLGSYFKICLKRCFWFISWKPVWDAFLFFTTMIQSDLSAKQWMVVVFVFPCTGMSNLNKSNSTWCQHISKVGMWWREKHFCTSHRQRCLHKRHLEVWFTIYLIYTIRKRFGISDSPLIYWLMAKQDVNLIFKESEMFRDF